MRILKSLFAVSLFATPLMADLTVFKGEAEWWRANEAIDVLGVEGIAMNAIEKAVSDCRAAGMTTCAIKTTSLVTHNRVVGNRHHSSATAIVHGSKSLSTDGTVMSASSSWNKSTSHDELDTLGIRADSLNRALDACFQKFETCVYLETSLIQCNEYRNGRYYSEAQTRVMGLGALH